MAVGPKHAFPRPRFCARDLPVQFNNISSIGLFREAEGRLIPPISAAANLHTNPIVIAAPRCHSRPVSRACKKSLVSVLGLNAVTGDFPRTLLSACDAVPAVDRP